MKVQISKIVPTDQTSPPPWSRDLPRLRPTQSAISRFAHQASFRPGPPPNRFSGYACAGWLCARAPNGHFGSSGGTCDGWVDWSCDPPILFSRRLRTWHGVKKTTTRNRECPLRNKELRGGGKRPRKGKKREKGKRKEEVALGKEWIRLIVSFVGWGDGLMAANSWGGRGGVGSCGVHMDRRM